MTTNERLEFARGISVDSTRRALLLLMLWPALEIDAKTVEVVQDLLPKGHGSIRWVRSGSSEIYEDNQIADLGDLMVCRAVLELLNPTPKAA